MEFTAPVNISAQMRHREGGARYLRHIRAELGPRCGTSDNGSYLVGAGDADPVFAELIMEAGLSLKQERQILAIPDPADTPRGHVEHVLSDQVHAHMAEPVTFEAHLTSLLDKAKSGSPTPHDDSGVCWILQSEDRDTDENRFFSSGFGSVTQFGDRGDHVGG